MVDKKIIFIILLIFIVLTSIIAINFEKLFGKEKENKKGSISVAESNHLFTFKEESSKKIIGEILISKSSCKS